MFDKKYEDRLVLWRELRDKIELSDTPFKDLLDFYNNAPRVRFSVDPWGQSTWPDPWQLLEENTYCEFSIVLGMCFSLQLTERFKGSDFEIHISTNNQKSETLYLLFVDDYCVNYKGDSILRKDLPDALYSQTQYTMPELQ